MMDTKTKVVLSLLFLAAIAATAASYYRYIILEDIEFFTEGFTLEEGN